MGYLLGFRVDIWVSFRTLLGKKLIFVSSYCLSSPSRGFVCFPLTELFYQPYSQSFIVSHVWGKVVGEGEHLNGFWESSDFSLVTKICCLTNPFNKEFRQKYIQFWFIIKKSSEILFKRKKIFLGRCLLYHWLLVHDILVLMEKFSLWMVKPIKINLPQILSPKHLDFLLKGNPNNNVFFSFPEMQEFLLLGQIFFLTKIGVVLPESWLIVIHY